MKQIEIIKLVNEMCIQSLSPDVFEKWEAVKEQLFSNRNSIRDESIVSGSRGNKFRKRLVVIEAEQYKEYGKLVKGMCNSQSCYVAGNKEPHVHTIHNGQIVILEVGDFIIPEPDGKHFYPCNPAIFEKTYEKVED